MEWESQLSDILIEIDHLQKKIAHIPNKRRSVFEKKRLKVPRNKKFSEQMKPKRKG